MANRHNRESTNILSATGRYELLDFIRGIAIGLMLIFHFCFGLMHLDLIQANFSTDYFWIGFRGLIVFLFLSLVGIGLVLATRQSLNVPAYFKRLSLLLIYLLLISGLSYLVLPQQYVFFGILHLIFVSSIIGLFFLRFYYLNLILALLILVVSNSLSFDFFNKPWMQWFGLMTYRPLTNDYAPIFPWFSLVLIGVFFGRLLLINSWLQKKLLWQANHWTSRLITLAGRYSLHIYFVHFQLFYLLTYFFADN